MKMCGSQCSRKSGGKSFFVCSVSPSLDSSGADYGDDEHDYDDDHDNDDHDHDDNDGHDG